MTPRGRPRRSELKIVRPAEWQYWKVVTPTAVARYPIVRWFFHCVASNGKILCHGSGDGDGYNSKRAALAAIRAVQEASERVVEK